MFETIEKAIFAGIGIGYLAKERVEEIGKKIVADAKVSEQQGKKFVDDLLKRSEDARLALEKKVNDTVNSSLQKADLARRSRVEKLEKRVSDLEKKTGK